jgi:hypothetical protein
MSKQFNFNLQLRATKVFELIIKNFNISDSWFATLKVKRIKFTITATSLLINIVNTLKIKKIKFTVTNSLVKLQQRLPMTMVVKKIKFTPVVRYLERLIQTLVVKKITLTAPMRQILRVVTSVLAVKKIKITAYPTVASFYLLSYWDPYYLSDMDSSNLVDLDYVITP